MGGDHWAVLLNPLSCRAILFDLDGVLVDSSACVEQHWRRWATLHGFDVQAILRVGHGRRTEETIAAVAPHLDAASEAAMLTRSEETQTDGVRSVPGARSLLLGLPADAWAIVTSGNTATALTRIRHCNLPEPRVLVSADRVSRGKPHPEPYLLAAQRLEIAPGDCIVVEDTPHGIAAGQAAGMHVIAIASTFAASALHDAEVIVDNLRALNVHRGPGGAKGRLDIEVSHRLRMGSPPGSCGPQ